MSKAGFRGTVLVFAAGFFIPLVQQPQVDGRSQLDARGNRWLAVFGRRKANVKAGFPTIPPV